MLPILLALVFPLHFSYWADAASFECPTTVDLRLPGQSMADSPILDQGQTNMCAQFTAAPLIDAWRARSLSVTERTSPMALGIEYAANSSWPYSLPFQSTTDPLSSRNGRWGGFVCPLIDHARSQGSCIDPALEDASLGKGAEITAQMLALNHELETFYAMKAGTRRLRAPEVARKLRTILETRAPRVPVSTLPSLDEIEKLLEQEGDRPYRILRDIALRGCAARRSENLATLPACRGELFLGFDVIGKPRETDPLRTEAAVKRLRAHLQTPNALPPAIAFCKKVFKVGRAFRGGSILGGSACEAHWSLVIGMRPSARGCQFLVRNSAHADEAKFSPDWEKDRGDLWIDADSLNRSIAQIQWLE